MNTNEAKNIIFFLGDGMGISTVTAGRIYKGQKKRSSGEESVLAVDTFPFTSLAKVTSDLYGPRDAYGDESKSNMDHGLPTL